MKRKVLIKKIEKLTNMSICEIRVIFKDEKIAYEIRSSKLEKVYDDLLNNGYMPIPF